MYHVSAQGVDERMINVHYYYYYNNLKHSSHIIVCTHKEPEPTLVGVGWC